LRANECDGSPSNGLAFSCRKRAGSECQKINDLAREAVNCNAMLGTYVWFKAL